MAAFFLAQPAMSQRETPLSQESPPGEELDPVYLHGKREALFILGLFGVCLTWSLVVCSLYGYLPPGEAIKSIPTICGIPSWVFWGIVAPWLFVNVVTYWFCFHFMADDDLGGTCNISDTITDTADKLPIGGHGEENNA